MMEYADYGFYHEKFYGDTIPMSVFPNVMLRASAYVRYLTSGKADSMEMVPEEVKYAACAAAEVLYQDDVSRDETGREKKSEENDGYSVSYVTGADTGWATLERKICNVVYPYLMHTGLLYRGVNL